MYFLIITDWSWERFFQHSTVPYILRIEQMNAVEKVSLLRGGWFFLVFWFFSKQITFFFFFSWETRCTLALKSAKYLSSWVFICYSKISDVSSSSGNKLDWLLDRWLWRVAVCRWQSCLWLLTGRSVQTSKKPKFLMVPQTAKKNKPHLFTVCLSFIWSLNPWTKLRAT